MQGGDTTCQPTWLSWGGAEDAADIKALIWLFSIHSGGAGAALRGGVRVEAVQGG